MISELPPPPIAPATPGNWLRTNLFNSPFNSALTILCVLGIGFGLKGFLTWATTQAQWAVLKDNLTLLLAGRFPADQIWRLWAIVSLLSGLIGLTWGKLHRDRPWSLSSLGLLGCVAALVVIIPIELSSRLLSISQVLIAAVTYWLGYTLHSRLDRGLQIAWIVMFPAIYWSIGGGWGLQPVPNADWSGLLLTLFAATICLILSFPLGVLLALARQSDLPVIRLFAIAYIEVLRGLPLTGVLFIALVMLPLLLPPQIGQPDPLVRAIAGLSLFAAAYIAETVRGGLQSVGRGQLEAARALGLNPFQVVGLILLPQALRAVIPALVGEFVSLFKETTLFSLFGLVELLGISAAVLANPTYIGRYAEVYLFIGAIYGVCCYAISIVSQRLEATLETAQR